MKPYNISKVRARTTAWSMPHRNISGYSSHQMGPSYRLWRSLSQALCEDLCCSHLSPTKPDPRPFLLSSGPCNIGCQGPKSIFGNIMLYPTCHLSHYIAVFLKIHKYIYIYCYPPINLKIGMGNAQLIHVSLGNHWFSTCQFHGGYIYI